MKTAIVLLAVVVVALAMPHDVKEAHDKAIAGGLLCGVCKDLVQGAEGMGASAAKAFLEKEIKGACSHLGFFSSICEDELDKLVDDLVKYIEQGLSPEVCCQKVDCC